MRKIVGLIIGLSLLCGTASCAGKSTDPFRGLYSAATVEDVVVKDTTLAVQANILPVTDGAKVYSALSLTAIGLQAGVPLAAAMGTPTPTAAEPNPVSLVQLNETFTVLMADLNDLHQAISAGVSRMVIAAKATGKTTK